MLLRPTRYAQDVFLNDSLVATMTIAPFRTDTLVIAVPCEAYAETGRVRLRIAGPAFALIVLEGITVFESEPESAQSRTSGAQSGSLSQPEEPASGCPAATPRPVCRQSTISSSGQEKSGWRSMTLPDGRSACLRAAITALATTPFGFRASGFGFPASGPASTSADSRPVPAQPPASSFWFLTEPIPQAPMSTHNDRNRESGKSNHG